MGQRDLLNVLIGQHTNNQAVLEDEARKAIKEIAEKLWIEAFGGVDGTPWENPIYAIMMNEIDGAEWIPIDEQTPLNVAINALQSVEEIARKASKMLDAWMRENLGYGSRYDNE